MRAIDADELIEKMYPFVSFGSVDYSELKMVVKSMSTIQPEQRTGKWIPSDSQCGIRCSVCGVPVDDFCHSIDYIDLDYEPNFCPNCGWAMKGANDANTKI